MGCTQKDLYNYQRDMRKEAFGHDVELLQEQFEAKQEKNSSFYLKMEVDSENRLDRVFWADATSRRAFRFYGHVIVFDTTYNTNGYDMKFAPIVGVNKHGSTTLFACAFLTNEKSDSFIWLFEQRKIAMPSCKPKMIITDQDAAINVAIVAAFPDTKHRLYIWHILKKFPEKLDSKSPLYERDVDYVSCSCKKIESEGIPCRHMLACLKMLQFELLPEKYICQRWTKVANVDTIFDESGSVIHDVVDNSLLMKKSRLSNLAAKIIDKALLSESASKYVYENFDNIYDTLSSMVGNLNIEIQFVSGEASPSSLKRVINDPLEKKLINSGKRLKGGAEKAMEK